MIRHVSRKLILTLFVIFTCYISECNAFQGQSENTLKNKLEDIRLFYVLSNEHLDFANLKIAVDQIIDPSIDVNSVKKLLDDLTEIIRTHLTEDATSRQKIAAIRKHIYRAGEWNDNRPFAYDLSDPLGHNIQNKLLSTYLETRLGNCVSMPILFLILADRLGVQVSLSTAPFHLYVQYFDDEIGRWINLETTDGANPARNAWIRQNINMTDKSIEEGIFMRVLSRREMIGVISGILLEHYGEQHDYRQQHKIAELIIRNDPKNIDAILSYGSAAGRMLDMIVIENPNPRDLNPFERQRYNELVEQNSTAFGVAESLGWRPEKAKAAYID